MTEDTDKKKPKATLIKHRKPEVVKPLAAKLSKLKKLKRQL